MTLKVWAVPAISDNYIRGNTISADTADLQAQMCRGQYESLSFCVRSDVPIEGLTTHVKYHVYAGLSLPTLRFRHVASWWQKAKGVRTEGPSPVIVPEMLVNDPNFVVMVIQSNEYPTDLVDAESIQPIHLEANHTHQFWITVHVPDDCLPGSFAGDIELRVGGQTLAKELFEITVLPFELPKLDIVSSIFYRADLNSENESNLDVPRQKSEKDYLADLENMLRHGVDRPTIYQPFSDGRLFERAIELRRQAGVVVDPLYCTRFECGWNGDTTEINLLKTKVEYLEGIRRCNDLGIRDIYAYADDEAKRYKITRQFSYWNLAHECGLKFIASSGDASDLHKHAGNRPDIVLVNQGWFDYNDLPEYISDWHANGTDVWRYGMTSPHLPECFRWRNGLEVWCHGVRGICNFAYQDAAAVATGVWKLDIPGRRPSHDTTFTLPARTGPIDTIQYEGFAAGLVDIRYAQMLESLGGNPREYIQLPKWPQYAPADMYGILDRIIDDIMDRLHNKKAG